ncbi:hypothetical protein TgHK011_004682 [Trichoderma gracile]|nr:hypothetical protein TgHK011_004682 [Trichoderma gracile]
MCLWDSLSKPLQPLTSRPLLSSSVLSSALQCDYTWHVGYQHVFSFSPLCPKAAPRKQENSSVRATPLLLFCHPTQPSSRLPPLQLFAMLRPLVLPPTVSPFGCLLALLPPPAWVAGSGPRARAGSFSCIGIANPCCIDQQPWPLSPAKRLQRHQSCHRDAAIGRARSVLAERGKPSVMDAHGREEQQVKGARTGGH